jgi:ribosomal protein S18 acetylase RimI-like enzyme
MPTLKKLLEQIESDIENKVAAFERTLQSLYPEIDRVGIYFEKSNNALFLSDLYIKEEFRGQGAGSKVMNSITEFADNNNLPIVLIPEPDDENVSPKQLISFYKKFGFIVNTGKKKDYAFSDPFATTMYRLPKK